MLLFLALLAYFIISGTFLWARIKRRDNTYPPVSEYLLICAAPLLLYLMIPYPSILEPNIYIKILQLQQPGLFANDLSLLSTKDIGGYNFFTKTFSWIPLRLILTAFYTCYLLAIYSYIRFLAVLIRKAFNLDLSKTVILAILTCVLHLATVKYDKWGGFLLGDNDVFYYQFRHQTIAIILSLWGSYYFVQKRRILSAALLAMALNFHVNTGQHFCILLLVYSLLNFSKKDIRFYLIFSAFYIAIGSITLIPIIKHELLNNISTELQNPYIFISGYYRHPHHMIPSSWPLRHYILYGTFLSLGTVVLIKEKLFRSNDNLVKLAVIIPLLGVVLMFISYLFTEVFPSDSICKAQLFRFSVYSKAALLPLITCCFLKKLRAKHIVLLIAVLLTARLIYSGHEHPTFTLPEPISLNKFIVQNTKQDDIVVMPLYWSHNQTTSFMLNSQRSVYVDYARFPFTQGFESKWFKRILILLEEDIEIKDLTPEEISRIRKLNPRDLYNHLSASKISNIHKDIGSFYYLVESKYSSKNNQDYESIYSDKSFMMYYFPSPESSSKELQQLTAGINN